MKNIEAYIIKIDPEKPSRFGKGTYTRVYFRDINNPKINYILDVTYQSRQWKPYLEVNNYFTHLKIITNDRNGKFHIDGTSPFIYEGKVVKKSAPKMGFTF